jgi:hypothetical protein
MASTTAPKRSSASKRSKTPDEQNDEIAMAQMKAHFEPKKSPPMLFIPPNTVRLFAEMREKQAELATDSDHSLGHSSRADYERKYGSIPLKGRTFA